MELGRSQLALLGQVEEEERMPKQQMEGLEELEAQAHSLEVAVAAVVAGKQLEGMAEAGQMELDSSFGTSNA